MPARRITFVADELLGYHRGGGLGTSTSLVALVLADAGHEVEVLYLGDPSPEPSGGAWLRRYDEAGVRVRPLATGDSNVHPPFLGRMHEIDLDLRSASPDVVVTQDLGAPGYAALRMRQAGLAHADTRFVVRCSGTRRWVAYAHRKVNVFPGALGISLLERASIELADVVVSQNQYMIRWMHGQGWSLPEQTVAIPNLIAPEGPSAADADHTMADRVDRLAFFGRFEARKGIELFVAALGELDPSLLSRVEVAFVGSPMAAWPPERIEALIPAPARAALVGVTFETGLDREEAHELLRRPGTLAVMPALEDNSPNTVVECLELGIPFIASAAGGTPELVAAEDRERVLFEPTREATAEALRRALVDGLAALRPARPAHDDRDARARWLELVESDSNPHRSHDAAAARVDVIVTHRRSPAALERCLRALAGQSGLQARVIVALAGPAVAEPEGLPGSVVVTRSERSSFESARAAGLEAANAPFVCFLDEEDVPDPELLETLVRAQAASGADVVSCGIRVPGPDGERVHLFLGEPGGLGVLGNAYGTVSLVRRSLLEDLETPWPSEHDPDWVLLARSRSRGARIVALPLPLATRPLPPGSIELHASDALLVIEALERGIPDPLRSVVRLAAGTKPGASALPPAADEGIMRRGARLVRKDGLISAARRAGERALRTAQGDGA